MCFQLCSHHYESLSSIISVKMIVQGHVRINVVKHERCESKNVRAPDVSITFFIFPVSCLKKQQQTPFKNELPSRSDIHMMHRTICFICADVKWGGLSFCMFCFHHVHVLCGRGALLEAAVSIVLERRVSTYYTSYGAEKVRERLRQKDRVSLFVRGRTPFGSRTL